MNTYARGTSVQVSVEFLDLSKAAFDPATVICQIKTPAGTETTYTYGDDDELVRDSAGKYHLWVDADESGSWAYRFKGTDDVDVANEATFDVNESEFSAP
jgi:hypothetical protein